MMRILEEKQNSTRHKGKFDIGVRDHHVSGTGRGKELSKQGSGKFNWGKQGQAYDESITHSGVSSKRFDNIPLESDQTITYDEYIRRQQFSTVQVTPSLPEPRKPNEGADQSKWSQYIQLPKKLRE